jgi:hypothetical protein
LESGIICRACSASSLGTPVMSDGCHAKMSRFSWRNSTSALSYLGDRFVPIEVVLVASPATSSTCFVSTVGLKVGRGWKLPAWMPASPRDPWRHGFL